MSFCTTPRPGSRRPHPRTRSRDPDAGVQARRSALRPPIGSLYTLGMLHIMYLATAAATIPACLQVQTHVHGHPPPGLHNRDTVAVARGAGQPGRGSRGDLRGGHRADNDRMIGAVTPCPRSSRHFLWRPAPAEAGRTGLERDTRTTDPAWNQCPIVERCT